MRISDWSSDVCSSDLHFMNVEVDVLFVTALLTTLSFSVHDTIVVFDRIREKNHQFKTLPMQTIANAAVIETLGRSINNSLTIIIMLLALTVLGGVTICWFALALLIGRSEERRVGKACVC